MAIHAAYWRMGVAGLEGTTKQSSGAVEAGVTVLAIDKDSHVVLCICDTTAHVPSAKAGYALGCILLNQQTGKLYTNCGAGTVLSCAFAVP